MLRFICYLPILCISLTVNAEDSFKRPQFINPSEFQPVHRSFKASEDILKILIKKDTPILKDNQKPAYFRTETFTKHLLYDLTALVQPNDNYTLNPKEWIIFDATSKSLHCYMDSRIYELFEREYLDSSTVTQNKISARILSVKRQPDPFVIWSSSLIQQANPKEIFTFNLTARSGERCILKTPLSGKKLNECVIEAFHSEDNSLVDITINLQLSPRDGFEGLGYSSAVTLATSNNFIQPIGISTHPERLYLLEMKVDIIDAKGKILTHKSN